MHLIVKCFYHLPVLWHHYFSSMIAVLMRKWLAPIAIIWQYDCSRNLLMWWDKAQHAHTRARTPYQRYCPALVKEKSKMVFVVFCHLGLSCMIIQNMSCVLCWTLIGRKNVSCMYQSYGQIVLYSITGLLILVHSTMLSRPKWRIQLGRRGKEMCGTFGTAHMNWHKPQNWDSYPSLVPLIQIGLTAYRLSAIEP